MPNQSPSMMGVSKSEVDLTTVFDDDSSEGVVDSSTVQLRPKQPANKRGAHQRTKQARRKGSAPSRPLSAYNIFFRDQRAKIAHEQAQGIKTEGMQEAVALCEAQFQDKIKRRIPVKRQPGMFEFMAKIIGKRWRKLSKNERERYTELSKEDEARYRAEKEIFHQKVMAATIARCKSSAKSATAGTPAVQREPPTQQPETQSLHVNSPSLADRLGRHTMLGYTGTLDPTESMRDQPSGGFSSMPIGFSTLNSYPQIARQPLSIAPPQASLLLPNNSSGVVGGNSLFGLTNSVAVASPWNNAERVPWAGSDAYAPLPPPAHPRLEERWAVAPAAFPAGSPQVRPEAGPNNDTLPFDPHHQGWF